MLVAARISSLLISKAGKDLGVSTSSIVAMAADRGGVLAVYSAFRD